MILNSAPKTKGTLFEGTLARRPPKLPKKLRETGQKSKISPQTAGVPFC